jgi:hypothetical protein
LFWEHEEKNIGLGKLANSMGEDDDLTIDGDSAAEWEQFNKKLSEFEMNYLFYNM